MVDGYYFRFSSYEGEVWLWSIVVVEVFGWFNYWYVWGKIEGDVGVVLLDWVSRESCGV